jgi:EAL domain-containing protein (putative c-di-GMP-specific phosphodiesterase class I)
MQSLKNTGVSISLDDFGTGYASMSQLRTLPFDRIKIDRSFVSSLVDGSQSEAIISTIASLGRALSLPITAEGIECDRIREKLAGLGCSDGQGWLFGKAVSGQVISDHLGKSVAGKPEAGKPRRQAKSRKVA